MTLAHELLGRDFKIIDADTHFTEPYDLWTSRAPAKYRDRVPQVRPTPDGRLKWYVNGDIELANAGAGSIIDRNANKTKFWDVDIMNHIMVDEAHPGSWDVAARLEIMERQGVWAHIVYPNVAGFGAGRLLRLEDRDLAYKIVQVYNDALAEWQEESGGRLFPQMLVPFWNIDHTVEEIARCHAMGLRGLAMSGEPFNGGLPDLQDRHWDPMYEVCTELEMPINIHIGSGDGNAQSFKETYGARTWPTHDLHRAYVLMCVQVELTNSNFVSNLVTSDILVRYPKLKFVSVESGIGWIPYVLERTDYQLQEALPDDPAMQRPSAKELFRRGVYATFWFEDSAPRNLIADVGFDNVMFETDFPHPTCLYPNPVDYALERLREHDVENIKKVMGGNAATLYKIDVNSTSATKGPR